MFWIDRPRSLLRLAEGTVFDDAERMIEELARAYDFSGVLEHELKKMGDSTNSTTELEPKGDGRQAKFILKPFPELNSAKWFILNLRSISAKRFNMTPLSRLGRELEGARRPREIGIGTHRIAGVVLSNKTLVTEFEEGVPLDRYVRDIAEGRAPIPAISSTTRGLWPRYRAGLVYGDTKPANTLVGKDGLYLLDLEQAVEGGDMAWDLAQFLYFSVRTARKEGGEAHRRRISLCVPVGEREPDDNQGKKDKVPESFLHLRERKMSRAVRGSLEAHSSPDEVV